MNNAFGAVAQPLLCIRPQQSEPQEPAMRCIRLLTPTDQIIGVSGQFAHLVAGLHIATLERLT